MVAPLDAAAELLVQGLKATWPGQGTPTALPLIGRSRGILRGLGESDASYGARLITWLDKWRAAGSAEGIASAIAEYLPTPPKIRVITRSGYWVTRNTDGTIDRDEAAWDWDSVSNPERSTYWSEIWVVVYTSTWGTAGPFLDVAGNPQWGEDELGIGHDVSRQEYDAINGLIAQWKAAHTKVRAVIYTTDNALFDPAAPLTCPDGTWGNWGTTGSGSRVASGRNITTCRYWEPK